MALALNDRVQETGTANTTVSFTLTGTVAGFQSFAVVGNGNTTYYAATDGSGNWEVGIGTYATVGPTLTRDTILASSNSGSAVTFSGAVNVFVTYPAEKSINYDADGVATIGETLSYSDTGIIGSFASTVAGYNQVVIQNKSAATNASANLNISNDVSTGSTGYVEVGINSSNFTGTGSFNLPSASYLASASTDLTVGTYGAYNVHFVTNSNATDAMTIFNSGGVSLGGYGDPGIGTLYANNVYLGFNTITAAAGTTILTNASAAWQNVVGTTTQSIQLPDATTLFKGFAFTITSSSTGAVTIKDNASATIDTVVTGGSAIMVLTDNSTSAGTWKAYSYLPASYDFSATTANFGNATISNAVWNGTTIATGYGGTGLTTFTAANNAIYSTSSSALAAGTLPVAAGGSGVTTFTANGVLYGDGTNPLGVTAAGTTGQVLIGNTGAAPTWGSLSSSAVTSFQTSLSGLTPSTATSGAVTLAGTLGSTSGGTGYSTTAVGDLLQGGATNTWAKLAAVATGNALISGGVTTASSWGKIGLTTHVSGTLPIGNGGTNLTTYTTGDIVYANATNTLASLADVATGNALISGGIGVVPSYGKIGLTTHVSGTLPVGNGGTGATTLTANGIVYGNGTSAVGVTAAGTTGQVLLATTGAAPTWGAVPASGVTSITGTANQITASASTGAVTLSTPSTFIAPGSIAATTTVTGTTINASQPFIVNSNTATVSYSIPSGSSAMSAGPITVNSGVVITVPSGSKWVVL